MQLMKSLSYAGYRFPPEIILNRAARRSEHLRRKFLELSDHDVEAKQEIAGISEVAFFEIRESVFKITLFDKGMN